MMRCRASNIDFTPSYTIFHNTIIIFLIFSYTTVEPDIIPFSTLNFDKNYTRQDTVKHV